MVLTLSEENGKTHFMMAYSFQLATQEHIDSIFLMNMPCEMEEVVISCLASIAGQNCFAMSEHLLLCPITACRSVAASQCDSQSYPHPDKKQV
jgi:hypothetical protein